MKVMAAHQPNFMPYLGFFDKMAQSNVFIIRDECQFAERDYHHRNRIRLQGIDGDGVKWDWVTVPVHGRKDQLDIKDMKINVNYQPRKNKSWRQEMLNRIEGNYSKAPFFRNYFPPLKEILSTPYENLIDLNMAIIFWLAGCFNIHTQVEFASKLPGYKKSFEPNADLVAITKGVGVDVYLSGAGGKTYLNLAPFHEAGIEVRFQEFIHPVYRQRYEGFAPYMAAIDALFCAGPSVLADSQKQVLNNVGSDILGANTVGVVNSLTRG